MSDAIGGRTDEKHPERQAREGLLEFDTAVHRDQRFVFSPHASKKLTVRDAGPATADDRVDTVALEHRSEIERNLLVKKNAH